MQYKEYGRSNDEVIVLLHGGGLGPWNYREEAELLKERFHVVLPILDGHAGSDRDFATIEENARYLIEEIDARFGGRVLVLGGLSLGAQVAAEMLARRPGICRFALLESALVLPMKCTHALIAPAVHLSAGLIAKPWFSKMQRRALGLGEERQAEYYRDSCAISEANLIAFLKANAAYAAPCALQKTEATVKIIVGGREQKKMRDSAKLLHEMIPGSALEILKGYHHGEWSLNHPRAYTQSLLRWMERGAEGEEN